MVESQVGDPSPHLLHHLIATSDVWSSQQLFPGGSSSAPISVPGIVDWIEGSDAKQKKTMVLSLVSGSLVTGCVVSGVIAGNQVEPSSLLQLSASSLDSHLVPGVVDKFSSEVGSPPPLACIPPSVEVDSGVSSGCCWSLWLLFEFDGHFSILPVLQSS
jgi:hypothetical protein